MGEHSISQKCADNRNSITALYHCTQHSASLVEESPDVRSLAGNEQTCRFLVEEPATPLQTETRWTKKVKVSCSLCLCQLKLSSLLSSRGTQKDILGTIRVYKYVFFGLFYLWCVCIPRTRHCFFWTAYWQVFNYWIYILHSRRTCISWTRQLCHFNWHTSSRLKTEPYSHSPCLRGSGTELTLNKAK